jgi:hypothetical protein
MELVGRTKGIAWAEGVRAIEQLYGREKLVEAVAAMPGNWRCGLDVAHETLGILPGSWYPDVQRHAFYDALLVGLSPFQQRQLGRKIADAVMARSLRGVHKVIFALMATPERFVNHAQTLWRQHHDSGTLRMFMLSPNSLEAALVDWPTHHPFACLVNHISCGVTLEAMGCRDVSQKRVCISDGAAECVGVYYWRAPA